MREVVKYLFVVSVLFFVGCKPESNAGDAVVEKEVTGELKELVVEEESLVIPGVEDRENGYVREKKIENFTYTAYQKPTEYLLAKARIEKGNDSLSANDFEDLQYFDLRIRVEDFNQEFMKYDLSDAGQYKDRVNYCAFNMQNDLKLVEGKDTLRCVLFHFERTFNTVPYGHFLLAFEKGSIKTNTIKTLIFRDGLFNNGILKFSFQPKKITIKKSLA